MQTEYRNFGIQFTYPEDWSLIDEDASGWPRRVSVQSPHTAYWELQIYPAEYSPVALTQKALDVFREEYADLDSQPVSESVDHHQIVGYDLDFLCLDFVVTCQVRSLSLGGQTLLLICQAESREYEEQREVFEAITRSLTSAEAPPSD